MDRRKWAGNTARIMRAIVWWLFVAAAAMAAGCDAAPPEAVTAVPTPVSPSSFMGTIVAVGDSLTAGLGVEEAGAYPARLARRLASDGYDFQVINAGVSGETSSGALARIQWVISSLEPDIVVLATGANDGLRGLDPQLLARNLDQLLAVLKANNIQVVLAGMRMLPNLGPEYIEAFDAVYPRAAADHGVAFVPFFLNGVAGEPRYNQADRIHPTAEGYRLVVDNIYAEVVGAVKRHLAAKK